MQDQDPPELRRLRERLSEVAGVQNALRLLFWDQNTCMPPAGAAARGEAVAALEGIIHRAVADPEVGRLLDALDPWAAGLDPDGDDARELAVVRRDHERATRVPEALLKDIARAGSTGQAAWLRARSEGDFGLFRDALERHIDLRRRLATCFPEAGHPYDALLDEFQPGATVDQLRPLFDELTDALAPIVAAASASGVPSPFPPGIARERQEAALRAMLDAVGFDHQSWRLDEVVHPFAISPGVGDYRMTVGFREYDVEFALYAGLHEFGHALYESGVGDDPTGHPLQDSISLGVHESQSRMWENHVGRSRPFASWAAPLFNRHLGLELGPDELYRGLNGVRPSLIRIEADETTYNLHVALRFELELALLEGTLEVADVQDAWDERVHALLGIEVDDVRRGVLQDIHWSVGLIGYFPTYTLGNLLAAQLWERIRSDLPDLDDAIAGGDFAPLRDWLRTHVHSVGRRLTPDELTERVTGAPLSAQPFLSYLTGKLADAGVLPAGSTPAAA